MNTYRYSNNQIANHFITTFITHNEINIPEITEKNIQQEHRFITLNALTVNET